jgi:DNA-binding IclR family transcriptional regulator
MDDHDQRAAPRYPIASVDRSLRLLKELKRRPQLSLTCASDILGVGGSTAHRLLQMLVFEGFAVQDTRSRTYMAGPELTGFNPADELYTELLATGQPLLQGLAARSGETVHLGVLNGSHIHYVAGVESLSVLRVGTRVGDTSMAYASSLGKAMLASYGDDVVASMFDGVRFDKVTRHTITSLEALLDELRVVRRRGYAINIEEAEVGVTSTAVAVPVPGPSSMVALSVAIPLSRRTDALVQRHITLLRVATRQLAAELHQN